MTSFHNPTGATLTDERKRALIDLLAARNVPLIEDDVYGELHFGTSPTRPPKLYDDSGLVLHCGSFSKCLAPGFRIGWVAAGRYVRQIRQQRRKRRRPTCLRRWRFRATCATARTTASCASCAAISPRTAQMLAPVRAYFPAGTEVFAPRAVFQGSNCRRAWMRCTCSAMRWKAASASRRADLFRDRRISSLSSAQLRPAVDAGGRARDGDHRDARGPAAAGRLAWNRRLTTACLCLAFHAPATKNEAVGHHGRTYSAHPMSRRIP